MAQDLSALPINEQRVLKIIDAAIQKMETLQSLAYLSSHASVERSSSPSFAIQEILTEYVKLSQTSLVVQNSNDNAKQNAFRLRLRRFLSKSSDKGLQPRVENGLQTVCSKSLRVLCQNVKDYRAIVYRKAKHPDQEYDEERLNVMQCETTANQQKAKHLQQKNSSMVEEKNFKMNEMRSRIQELEEEITKCEEIATAVVVDSDKKMREELIAAARRNQGVCGKYEEEVAQLQNKLETLRSRHWQQEMDIRTKKRGLEREYEDLKKDFEENITIKQSVYQELFEDCSRVEEEAQRFQTLASILKSKHDAIVAERRRLEQQRITEMEELAAKTKAAIRIQARWRGYFTRRKIRGGGDKKKRKRMKRKEDKKK